MLAEYPLVRNLRAFSTRCGVRWSPSRSGSSPSSASSRLTTSCIALFYICLAAASGAAQDPDALYVDRANLASAAAAATLWANVLQENPKDFAAAWKLARMEYWLGGHAAEKERRPHLE